MNQSTRIPSIASSKDFGLQKQNLNSFLVITSGVIRPVLILFTLILILVSVHERIWARPLLVQDRATEGDKARVDRLNASASNELRVDPTSSLRSANEALESATISNYADGITAALLNKGNALDQLKRYQEAIDAYAECVAIYTKYSNPQGKAYCYRKMGMSHISSGDQVSGERFLKDALELFKQAADRRSVGQVHANLATLYSRTEEYDKAAQHFRLSFDTRELLGDERNAIIVLSNWGSALANWGNYDGALEKLERALKRASAAGHSNLISSIERNIASVRTNLKGQASSITQFEITEGSSKEEYILKIEGLNQTYEGVQRRSLAEIAKLSIDNQVKELKIRVQRDDYEAKLKDEEYAKVVAEQRAHIAEKESEIIQVALTLEHERVRKQRIYIVLAVSGILLIGGFSFVLSRSYKQKKKDNILLQEQNELIVNQKDEIEIQRDKIEIAHIKVKKVNEHLNDFAKIVSHDLRSPVIAISNMSKFVLEDEKENLSSEGVEQIVLVNSNSERLLQMIEGILSYSKVGMEGSEKETVDLNQLLKDVVDLLNPPTYFKITSDELPPIYANRFLLTQVFSNLIGNSIKYNDNNAPTLHLSSLQDNDLLRFHVTDNGPGIPEKYLEKIFELFATVGTACKHSSGVGLATVKKIIEENGGMIWVDSPPGEGTTFSFTWPTHKG